MRTFTLSLLPSVLSFVLPPDDFLAALAPSMTEPSISASMSSPFPLIIWHGLGDNFEAHGLASVAELANATNPGTYAHIIRLADNASGDRTATFFGNLTEQIEMVCEQVTSNKKLMSAPAINALGFSQGGQFLRGLVERCEGLEGKVNNLVTFGSQHNGIAEFQVCEPTDFLCKGAMGLLRANTWSQFVQSRLVPAQYYRSINESTGEAKEEYLEHSNFLADINNERKHKNSDYKKRLSKLNKMVMYVFEDDTTVIPRETGWFAEVLNRTSDNPDERKVIPLKERPIYKEDWLGLKALDKKGGLAFKTAPGGHMRLSDKLLESTFKEYFAPPKSKEVEEDEEADFVIQPIWEDL